MKKCLLISGLVILLPLGVPLAQEAAIGADAEQLICDAGLVIDCSAEGECSTGSPESVDLPRFLRLDLATGELTSPSPGFAGEATPLGAVERGSKEPIARTRNVGLVAERNSCPMDASFSPAADNRSK